MAKRLKKVIIPKETQKGPFVPPTAPAVLSPAVFAEEPAKPAEPTEFSKRYQAAKDKARARQEAGKALYGPPNEPPFNPSDLLSTTEIAGHTISDWDKILEQHIETVGTKVVDLSGYPDWVCWAVSKWNHNGKPTPSMKVLDQITKLREDAEKLVTFANLDKEKAKNQDAVKAKKLTKAAEAKNEKAAKLFEEANALAKEHKKS
jgi:hypothetical protein